MYCDFEQFQQSIADQTRQRLAIGNTVATKSFMPTSFPIDQVRTFGTICGQFV
jgi:hypothetical protein